MNKTEEYRALRKRIDELVKEQLNYNLANEIGSVMGKTYYLDGKAIYAVYEGLEGGYAIFEKLLDSSQEIEFYWNKLPLENCGNCGGVGSFFIGRDVVPEKCIKCNGTGKK